MPTTLLRRTSVAALGLAAILVACDKSPTAPSQLNTTPNNPPPQPAGPATFLRIELTGPAAVPPNDSAQYKAEAVYSDGSRRDVSGEASWRTGAQAVLTISAAGLATGRAVGETWITASWSGRSVTKNEVIVVPAGTYRVMGSVLDSGVLVPDAEVRVMSGPSQGLNTRTASGAYRLYGVAGDSELRVTKNGYEEARRRIIVSNHERVDFTLTLSNPREDIAGTYTLKVTAADACRSMLPAELWSRSYDAVITQTGPRLQVKLQGATFYRSGSTLADHFSGTIEPGRAVFQISGSYYYYYYYLPSIVEQIPGFLFSFSGTAVVTSSPTGKSGKLSGAFVSLDSNVRPKARCNSTDHQFELIR
jgi:hypothetical protein